MIESIIKTTNTKTDLIILPEMFTTGFSMQPEKLAEDMNGTTIRWMSLKSQEWNCIITGSLIIKEKGKYLNRLIWMAPDGNFQYYDKRHLFRMGEEHDHYTAGDIKLITKFRGWGFRPLICYDLRFPVWSRNRSDYNVLIYIANWPESRREVWKSLLVARALENQAYVIGVNRIGSDGRNISYSGDSMLVDSRGQIISETEPYEESAETVRISLDELMEFREKFPVYLDADEFVIKDINPQI